MTARAIGDAIRARPLCYAAAAYLAMLAAWEVGLRVQPVRPTPLERALAGGVSPRGADEGSAADSAGAPCRRILILGSSQIHSVRGGEAAVHGFPAQLERIPSLDQRSHAHPPEDGRESMAPSGRVDVVDLSSGGQQLVESLALLLDAFDAVRPECVILGVGLYNLQSTAIRDEIAETADWEPIAEFVEHCGRRDDFGTTALREVITEQLPPAPGADATLQERADARLSDMLESCVTIYRGRARLYDELIRQPIQRDWREAIERRVAQTMKATTFGIGPSYAPSLAAVRVVAEFCRERGVPLVLVEMPFRRDAEPPPYVAHDAERFADELSEVASATGASLLRLCDLLAEEHFGFYRDGSPDAFHYTAAGHRRLAETVAGAVGPLLESARNDDLRTFAN